MLKDIFNSWVLVHWACSFGYRGTEFKRALLYLGLGEVFIVFEMSKPRF